MKHIKKLNFNEEVFTEKEKKKLIKSYEKGKEYYNETKEHKN